MIALLLAPGFEEVEAVTVADFLNRAGIDIRLVGITDPSQAAGAVPAGKRPLITGAHRLTIQADLSIADVAFSELANKWTGVVVPGGMPGSTNVAESEKAMSLIKELFTQGRLVAAICAAPAVVLQKAGILKGKKVTCYPGLENKFKDCQFLEDRVVVDGQLVTSRSPGTAAEFALKLVELLAGKKKADEIHKATLQC